MKIPMKTFSLLASAALFTLSSLSAVETDPVGYVTETVKPATFNVIGVNLVSPVVASGVLDASSGADVTDTQGTFLSGLSSEDDYYITLLSGVGSVGINTSVSALSDTVLTTDDDLSSYVTNGSTQYQIRKLLTVEDLFGSNNELELQGALEGDFTTADILWIPASSGGYDKVYYNSTPRTGFGAISVGWKTTDGGDTDASDIPVYFSSGILVEVRRAAFTSGEKGVDPSDLFEKDLLFTGSVVTTDIQTAVFTGFNYVGRVFPSTMTLAESSLESEIIQAEQADFDSADLIWVPNGSGGYNKYYYNGTPRTGFGAVSVGWKSTTGGDTDVSSASITSGFIIQRRGVDTMVTLPTLL